MDNFDLKKYLTEGKLHENEFGGMGLIVKGETSKDNDLIDQAVEESGFYGVYNSRENYWFFPEEGDSASMDTLENELENIFIKKGANVSYEAQFNENLKLEEDLENGLDNKIWDFRHLIKNFDPLDIKVGDTVITPTEGENIIDKIVKYGWDFNYGDIINFQFGNKSLSNKDLIQRNNRRK
jgi:hypothetical protein